MKIVYCQATFDRDLDKTVECVNRVAPYVDETVIVYDQTLTEEQVAEALHPHEAHLVYHEWNDDMPDMRNSYIEKARELKADWIIVSDPDELFNKLFVQNIRSLIDSYDARGYTQLAVHARDQFENVEWLDELDLLKESPGGYRETDFWKPLLVFKLHHDTHYEGVGVRGRVHESLNQKEGFKLAQLPKEYYYTHKKSALRIWRNAARNMFIGGGGDNVGELNPHWVRLRELMNSIGVDEWPKFEAFVQKYWVDYTEEITEAWINWTMEALQAPPTNWGTETRETAKWFWALNSEEITPEIQELISNPPEMTEDIELENFVTRMYFEVLGRHPDEAGKQNYVESIKKGTLRRDQLKDALMASPEYAKRAQVYAGVQERKQINVPVHVQLDLNESIFIEALKKSRVWWDGVKPKMDLGVMLIEGLQVKKADFINWFYDNYLDVPNWEVIKKLDEMTPYPDSVACCIMGYHDGLPMILKTVEIIDPYVDEIHVQGDDFTVEDEAQIYGYEPPFAEEGIEEVSKFKPGFSGKRSSRIYIHDEPWKDDFSDYKNKAISHVNTQWVMICDHDEIPTIPMAMAIPELIAKSDRGKVYNMVQFKSLNQVIPSTDSSKWEVVVEENLSDGKPLMHWSVPYPYYGTPHIWLKPGHYPWRSVKVEYAYRHVKTEREILERSARNVWLGGGGDNSREKNPLWVPLRNRCNELGYETWNDFDEYLIEGGIDFEVLDLLRQLTEIEWKDDELHDLLRYYYSLHPEEEDRYE